MKSFFSLTWILVILIYGCETKEWTIQSDTLLFQEPPFSQCHAPTLVETENNELLAAWFAGTSEGHVDVEIWGATWDNETWSEPFNLVGGYINDSTRYPCWNPVLFKENNEKISLYYKVGPSPQTWWGMVMHSSDLGKTWSIPERLADGIFGPIKNKPVLLNDSILLSGSSTEYNGIWKVHMERSEDAGKSWEAIPVDTGSEFEVIQPAILVHKNNRLQILCRSKQGYLVQSWSDNLGLTWGKFEASELPNPNSGVDVASLKNGTHLIVYNPDLPGKEWFDGRAKLRVAASKDGLSWTDIAVLENGTTEEYSYPAIIEANNGLVHILYTYDRKNIKHVVLK